MSAAPFQTAPATTIGLSQQWQERLAKLVAGGKKAAALAFLEKAIGETLPLFADDPGLFGARRAAWLMPSSMPITPPML